jgi:glycosyltransferase involved in cell wall biosynthesis
MLTAVSGGGFRGSGSPRVSVVMAVRDGERFVAEAIESLQAQTLDDFELVVVDDGSTDSTAGIVQSLAAQDERIRLHSQSNTGYPEALNVGWGLARGEYVAILDADDLAEPGRLERQLVYLDDHPEVGVVGGSLLLVTGDGRPFYVSAYPATAAEVVAGLQTHCPVGHTAVLMRRAILEEVGGYRSAVALAEDYDLWLRVSERHPIVNLPDIVGRYRIHGANASQASIRRGAEAIVRARADAAERRGEPHQAEAGELAEAELGLALWWAEVSARAGAGWHRREREAWRLARLAARRTRDPAESLARIRTLQAKLDARRGPGVGSLRRRLVSRLALRGEARTDSPA